MPKMRTMNLRLRAENDQLIARNEKPCAAAIEREQENKLLQVEVANAFRKACEAVARDLEHMVVQAPDNINAQAVEATLKETAAWLRSQAKLVKG